MMPREIAIKLYEHSAGYRSDVIARIERMLSSVIAEAEAAAYARGFAAGAGGTVLNHAPPSECMPGLESILSEGK